MKNQRYPVLLMAVMLLLSFRSAEAADSTEKPLAWASTGGGPAEGYSIDLVSISPAPGSYVRSGGSRTFEVKVRYSLTVAAQGRISLIFSDEKGEELERDTPRESQTVSAPGGSLSLRDSILIPAGANELRLAIPLIPEGAEGAAHGVIDVRYPLVDERSTGPRPGRGFPPITQYYPDESWERGEEGTPTVRVCLDAEGKVTEPAQLIKSSGFERLDQAAVSLAFAGSGHYVPGQHDGHGVAGCMTFNIDFAKR